MIMLTRIFPININPRLMVGVYKSCHTSRNFFQRRQMIFYSSAVLMVIRQCNYSISSLLILNQNNDIGDVHTQDMFISNMKRCNDVRSIVTFERTSPDQWIKDRYKGENFMNTMSNLYNELPTTTNTSG